MGYLPLEIVSETTVMRYRRIPRREKIRRSEVVRVVDTEQQVTDPRDVIIAHVGKIEAIIQDLDGVMPTKDITAIKRSLAAIQKRLVHDE